MKQKSNKIKINGEIIDFTSVRKYHLSKNMLDFDCSIFIEFYYSNGDYKKIDDFLSRKFGIYESLEEII